MAAEGVYLQPVPARAKLTPRRRNRLVALMAGGASLAEAARACGVTRGAVYKHAEGDPMFAERLRVVRRPRPTPVVEESWEDIAERLAAQSPERWGPLPSPWDH
jgi:AcrR family transcriptional regulator